MEDGESESVFISQFEFASIVQELPKLLKRFKGKHIINKFEDVVTEVVGSKYTNNVHLDYVGCTSKERQKLRSAFVRIEKKIRQNSKNGKPYSFGLPGDKPFISSEAYPTLVVSIVQPPKNERYLLPKSCNSQCTEIF